MSQSVSQSIKPLVSLSHWVSQLVVWLVSQGEIIVDNELRNENLNWANVRFELIDNNYSIRCILSFFHSFTQ